MNLTGNELANAIFGNSGANILNGGAGADYLQGLGGADSFAFTTALGGDNVDTIGDFTTGSDRILLDHAIFDQLVPGALNSTLFHVGTEATDEDQRIIYDDATGNLYYDADGIGGTAQVLFATLNGGVPLAASDFTVI
jgi:Ca2+-binding RTX toxin-like protein